MYSSPPPFDRFRQAVKKKRGASTGGMSGLTYDLVRQWPDSITLMAYDLISEAWQKKDIPTFFKWKWLIPIPKCDDPLATQLRPIMLIEVLRKLWTSLIVEDIHNVLLKHHVLHPSQHGFQPGHGTDTANIQVINVFEAAKEKLQALYASSWDMEGAFDTVSSPIATFAFLRLGIPPFLASWLAALDQDTQVVLRSGHEVESWASEGVDAIPTSDRILPTVGIGQGDVSSPLTWVVVFDMLLCAMSRVSSEGLFRLNKPSGEAYAAPDVAYADDLISFAASLLGLQRKVDMVSLVASILGLKIAIRKLRLLRKRWDLPAFTDPESLSLYRYMAKEVSVPLTSASVIKQLGVYYDADCSGSTQLQLSLTSFRQSVRAIAWKRASPEAIIYALEASSSSQVAYRATLSNWTWPQYELFDSILATELRHRTKNMATAQTDNLYQPAEHGGQGFHKISLRCNEGKKSFIDRALKGSDYQTRWAIQMLLRRAGASWPLEGSQGPIETWTSGWYISSLLEHGLRARRAL